MIKILMVEEDRVDQMAFERLVKTKNLPYEYVITNSIADAHNHLQAGTFDVVIIGSIPEDGTLIEAFITISYPPLLVLSGNHYHDTKEIAHRAGAAGYLIKDVTGAYLHSLPVVIEQAFQQKGRKI